MKVIASRSQQTEVARQIRQLDRSLRAVQDAFESMDSITFKEVGEVIGPNFYDNIVESIQDLNMQYPSI